MMLSFPISKLLKNTNEEFSFINERRFDVATMREIESFSSY